jgi:hypothetical protein
MSRTRQCGLSARCCARCPGGLPECPARPLGWRCLGFRCSEIRAERFEPVLLLIVRTFGRSSESKSRTGVREPRNSSRHGPPASLHRGGPPSRLVRPRAQIRRQSRLSSLMGSSAGCGWLAAHRPDSAARGSLSSDSVKRELSAATCDLIPSPRRFTKGLRD